MNTYGLFPGAPQAQGRPWDFVAGVDASNHEAQQRVAQGYALEQMLAQTKAQQLQNNRYSAQTPNEIDKSNLEGQGARARMSDPRYQSSMIGGEIGQAQSRQAQGSFDMNTLPGKTRAANTGYDVSYLENAARQLEMTLALTGGSGMMTDAKYQEILPKLPEEVRRGLPSHFDPSVFKTLDGMVTALKNNPTHNRQMDVEREQTDRAVKVANINANSARARASIAAGTRIRQAEEQLLRGNPGQRLSAAATIEADYQYALDVGDADAIKTLERLKRKADAVKYQSAVELATSLGVRMPPQLPGLPVPPAAELIRQIQSMANQNAPINPGAGGAQPSPGGVINFGDLKR